MSTEESSAEVIDDRLLRLARAVRKRYALPIFIVDDLKQIGWVVYLKEKGAENVMTQCYTAMRHSGSFERNGYRPIYEKDARQRFVHGLDPAQFPSTENLEARAGARHELNKIVSLCAARHRSYVRTLKSFSQKVSYTPSLNARRSKLRMFLRTKGLAA